MTGTAIFFLVILAVAVAGWAVARCRAWRAEARRKAAARLEAAPRHPSRLPGLPVDGDPLTDAELNAFTGILLRPPREPNAGKHGSPPAEGNR